MSAAPDNPDGPFSEPRNGNLEESVLTRIERLYGKRASVTLQAPATVHAPAGVDDARPDIVGDSRFEVLAEIARGGIGVIYRGRDKDLNREVAMKVLRPELASNRDIVQRFIEEAQVGGQLQHPGIVPVYALRLQADGRPVFAMKLIEGRTLDDLIDAKTEGIDLLAVFEQITQTMAYAHSHRVIHRDLKPANVMIGAFGEVQVVDWGFAKVLGREDSVEPSPGQTLIATVRSEASGSQSIAGNVMGTPGYMPPEQALGRVDDLDERADVFALGAILCEILTGEPPYTGTIRDQLLAAAQGQLDEARARIDACSATAGLKQLVRDCLAPLPKNRPRDAGAVSELLAAHFARVEQRARDAELGTARARADAALASRSRRRSIVLAGIALLALVTGGGGWQWLQQEAGARADRAAPRIAAELRNATGHEGSGNWPAAVAAARLAVQIAETEGVDATRARAVLATMEIRAAAAQEARRIADRDAAFLAELEELRGRRGQSVNLIGNAATEPSGRFEIQDDKGTDAAYAAAFARRFGSFEASAEPLMRSHLAADFAANLGFWCWLRKTTLRAENWQVIDQLARRLDPQNEPVRDALMADDVDALLAITKTSDDALPLALAAQVGLALAEHREEARAATIFLQRQHRRAPDDFWIHMGLAHAARTSNDLDLAIQHLTAALALRPTHAQTWCDLGGCFSNAGDYDAAVRSLQRAIALDPALVLAHEYLGFTHRRMGDYESAIAANRRAIELDPENPARHRHLADNLSNWGDEEAALAVFRHIIELDPSYVWAHARIGAILSDAGDLDEAVPPLQRAIELDANSTVAWGCLAMTHERRGDLAAAIVAYRQLPAADATLDWTRNKATSLEQLVRMREELEQYRARLGSDSAAVERAMRDWQTGEQFAAIRAATDIGTNFKRFWRDVEALRQEASR